MAGLNQFIGLISGIWLIVGATAVYDWWRRATPRKMPRRALVTVRSRPIRG